MRLVLGAISFLVVFGGAGAARADLMAGAAKVDLTPDVHAMRVPLGGYAARRGAAATGVHDPVYARALLISDGRSRVAIVSTDLCFLPANVADEVVRRLPALGVADIDAPHLFLAATHTHSAPDPLALHSGNTFSTPGWTSFDPKMLDLIAGRIARVIADAAGRQISALVGWTKLDAAGWNRNRRGGTLVDPTMMLLRITDSHGRPLAAVVNFAAHPTLFSDKNMLISADWPGVMTAAVETSLGKDAVCLFLNGAEGDAAPARADGASEEVRVASYGARMAALVLPALGRAQTRSDLALECWGRAVELPPRKPHPLFLLAASMLGLDFVRSAKLVDLLMPTHTRLSFVRLGGLVLIGFPCEPIASLGLAAKAAARAKGYTAPVVVALTNGWLGYALTPEEYRAGQYEASMSFYGPQFGPTIMEGLRDGLRTAEPLK